MSKYREKNKFLKKSRQFTIAVQKWKMFTTLIGNNEIQTVNKL